MRTAKAKKTSMATIEAFQCFWSLWAFQYRGAHSIASTVPLLCAADDDVHCSVLKGLFVLLL